MLIGGRVAMSMLVGWGVALLLPAGSLPWVASSLMVSGGLTAAALRLPALVASARKVGATRAEGLADRTTLLLAAGLGASVACLCLVSRDALGLPVSLTLASVGLAAPLLLVGTRVLGETNWAPVLSLATVAQAALGALSPGCVTVTMVGSVVAGAIPNGGQHMMQSFRAAQVVGARTRDTVIAQILGVVVGAAALAITSPMLVGLTSPLSEAWALFAEGFAGGAASVPVAAVVIAACAGVAWALAEKWLGRVAPSPTAVGIGMLVPGGLVAGIVAGACVAAGARRWAPRALATHGAAVASGLVAGEALAAAAMAGIAGG
jgi:hypothetical protein